MLRNLPGKAKGRLRIVLGPYEKYIAHPSISSSGHLWLIFNENPPPHALSLTSNFPLLPFHCSKLRLAGYSPTDVKRGRLGKICQDQNFVYVVVRVTYESVEKCSASLESEQPRL